MSKEMPGTPESDFESKEPMMPNPWKTKSSLAEFHGVNDPPDSGSAPAGDNRANPFGPSTPSGK